MSLLSESPLPPEEPRERSSTRTVLLGLGGLLAIVLLIVALWPSPPAEPAKPSVRSPPVAPAAPAPAVTPIPAEPREAPAPARSAPARARKNAAPVVEPEVAPAPPTTGTLTVQSDVDGASVFLDREFKGTTPVTIEGITPGSHQVNVSAEGYQGHAQTVDVGTEAATISVRFREVRLSEAIAVTHKHTIGSCRGRLSADTSGIRYETTNKDDAFSFSHAEVETFEVDYLQKNLRVKRRGGKTYNFTHDNPDVLFVFHKNVEAARARLAKGEPAGK